MLLPEWSETTNPNLGNMVNSLSRDRPNCGACRILFLLCISDASLAQPVQNLTAGQDFWVRMAQWC